MSWRKAHFARREKIDKTYVKIFINELARAVVLYGWNRVYNIDETSIRINNGSMRTVAPIRMEEVIVDKARNEKECFTAIGCCTRCEALPLVIVSKGKTDQSKLKCNVDNKETILLTKNSNGWTNEDVMLQYLEFFRKNIVGKDDCALVLDCLAAHRTPAVLNKAAELRIDLIFVPANGTGYYQPLDRRIFGILKSKLRSITGTQCLSGESRYSTITKYLFDSWEEIKTNEKALISAWNIPGLFDLVYKKEKNFEDGIDDVYIPPDFDEEEEDITTINEINENDNDEIDQNDDIELDDKYG